MQTVKGNINSPLTNYKKYPDEININILIGALAIGVFECCWNGFEFVKLATNGWNHSRAYGAFRRGIICINIIFPNVKKLLSNLYTTI